MSYCRWENGDSDVYVWGDHTGKIACAIPPDTAGTNKTHDGFVVQFLDSPQEMLAHLKAHIAEGNRVPAYAIEELEQEIEDSKRPC